MFAQHLSQCSLQQMCRRVIASRAHSLISFHPGFDCNIGQWVGQKSFGNMDDSIRIMNGIFDIQHQAIQLDLALIANLTARLAIKRRLI